VFRGRSLSELPASNADRYRQIKDLWAAIDRELADLLDSRVIADFEVCGQEVIPVRGECQGKLREHSGLVETAAIIHQELPHRLLVDAVDFFETLNIRFVPADRG
jgi:hypothetical protein